MGESFPTVCDACASLAKVLRCLCIQAQLGRICSLAWLPAWPADDSGLRGDGQKMDRAERGEDRDGTEGKKNTIRLTHQSAAI